MYSAKISGVEYIEDWVLELHPFGDKTNNAPPRYGDVFSITQPRKSGELTHNYLNAALDPIPNSGISGATSLVFPAGIAAGLMRLQTQTFESRVGVRPFRTRWTILPRLDAAQPVDGGEAPEIQSGDVALVFITGSSLASSSWSGPGNMYLAKNGCLYPDPVASGHSLDEFSLTLTWTS